MTSVLFVGPAGRVLVQALEDARIVSREAYVTNVVEHFEFTAAKALISASLRMAKQRGQLLPWPGGVDGNGIQRQIMATLHPSAILRMMSGTARRRRVSSSRICEWQPRFLDDP